MAALIRFLRTLFLKTPAEILVALLRVPVLLIAFVLILLLTIWEWILALLRRHNLYPESDREPCPSLPEPVVRRPDPCIYSQWYLQGQGLPVTWNNPDIWVAPASDPTAVQQDSYNLEENTDYIVSVRVHNASAVDPAIAVRVRLNYRPWSFNSPDLVPVQVDGLGNEVVRFVDVAPLGSSVTQFHWSTPPIPASQSSAHYCLQASLYHPMDTNTENNLGQENTNVYRTASAMMVSPGDLVTVDVPLVNPRRIEQ